MIFAFRLCYTACSDKKTTKSRYTTITNPPVETEPTGGAGSKQSTYNISGSGTTRGGTMNQVRLRNWLFGQLLYVTYVFPHTVELHITTPKTAIGKNMNTRVQAINLYFAINSCKINVINLLITSKMP